MALLDTRKTVLGIINEVQRKLALSETSTLTATSHAKLLLDFLNDVLDEISDDGDWIELRKTVSVSAVSGQSEYDLTVTGSADSVHHIHMIRLSGRRPELNVINDIVQYRLLDSMGTVGEPNQWVITSVNGSGNPCFGVWPRPGATQDQREFQVTFFFKPRLYTTSDANEVPPVSSRVLVQGVLAKAILDEAGGAETQIYQAEFKTYEKMLKQGRNRFSSDMGRTVQFTPNGR